jgi:uncharacterized damage-inducible protein DinB
VRIVDMWLPEFDYEMANTRKTLERVPEEKWDFKPHAKSFAMKQLVFHLMSIPQWVKSIIQDDALDIQPAGAPPYQLPTAASPREALEKFDAWVKEGREVIAAAEDESLMKNWSLLAGGSNLLTMPKTAAIRFVVLNHTVHHRAQLCVYLRLNDIPVPALYGPSADEKE